jgi:phenylpropionate dioxygenase-like ring-hydroxylating dioxygenase large terminal subunit
MGEDPVIVWRGPDGTIRCFLNMCRHRGNRVCRADEGNATSFMCSYHGWTYGSDGGGLVGVPLLKEAYYDELPRGELGLIEAPVQTYKGLIFANWDKSAPPLVDYLGDFSFYLDTFLDRREGGSAFLPGVHKWIINNNWKLSQDNFMGDWYHIPVSHATVVGGSTYNPPQSAAYEISAGTGALGAGWTPPGQDQVPLRADPSVRKATQDYSNDLKGEMEERLGHVRGSLLTPVHGGMFPNFAVLWQRRTFRVWHPRGPHQSEVWSWTIFDKDAPQQVKDEARQDVTWSFSPGGLFEQDDMDNWGQCTQSGKGFMSRQHLSDLSMGLGHEVYHEDIPGVMGGRVSENNQRHFYRLWRNLMSADRWSDVKLDPST